MGHDEPAVLRLATRIGRKLTPLARQLATSGLVSPIYYDPAYSDDDRSPGPAFMFGSGKSDQPFPHFPEGDGNDGRTGDDTDTTLALLLPLMILLSTLLFLLLLFLLFLIVVRRRNRTGGFLGRGRVQLGADDGPVDLSRDDEHWAGGEGGLAGMESRWLEQVDEHVRIGYMRSKLWQTHHPPNSQPTDITLSQFLSIQEKGVSAWAFEPDYDSNPGLPVFVQSRTEITFLGDGAGMAPEEGGGVCVQSNLPLPKLNEVYYWECKMYEKPDATNIAIGLATKPYPSFRLPGWNRLSIGYFAEDGFKAHNYPFTSTSYGPPLTEGDVLGVGYRPRTGSVFFTRNGKKLDDAFVGLHRHNVFPTVGSDGPAAVHVNLGQAGFVFIEANVKKWGLAPMAGTLAPPPAYGQQVGSILLAAAEEAPAESSRPGPGPGPGPGPRVHDGDGDGRGGEAALARRRSVNRSGVDVDVRQGQVGSSRDLRPVRPSPLRGEASRGRSLSEGGAHGGLAHVNWTFARGRAGGRDGHGEHESDEGDELPHNPPTPRPLDISLEDLNELRSRSHTPPTPTLSRTSTQPLPYDAAVRDATAQSARRGPSPPGYCAVDPHKYAAGVAEAMLAEQFPGIVLSTSSSSPTPAPTGPGTSQPTWDPARGEERSRGHWRSWLTSSGSRPAPARSAMRGARAAAEAAGAGAGAGPGAEREREERDRGERPRSR